MRIPAKSEKLLVDETVIDNDVGVTEKFGTAKRDQLGSARSGADEEDFTCVSH